MCNIFFQWPIAVELALHGMRSMFCSNIFCLFWLVYPGVLVEECVLQEVVGFILGSILAMLYINCLLLTLWDIPHKQVYWGLEHPVSGQWGILIYPLIGLRGVNPIQSIDQYFLLFESQGYS